MKKRMLQFCLIPVLCCWLTLITPALVSGIQTEVDLKLPEGFHGEKIYDVPNRQGSWVSMTTDSKGRLIVSDQYGSLYRINPLAGEIQIDEIPVKIGFAQGLLCAFDSLYVVAHASKFDQVDENGVKSKVGKPAGLYRVKDTNNDDVYDSVELLRKFDGGSEHGPHAVILGPDKNSLYICAGNHTKIPDPEKSRVPRVWQEDQTTPRLPDAGGHAVGKMAPGGWVCKTDPDGKEFELISIGYRNQYDMAFNSLGDLFTYDADMEWDIGLPWYRPTRVCHVTDGSEFGWRNGSGKWPTYFPDSLPPVIDIGPGSPTGITFGTGAGFPAEFQNALYIADWSYGIIHKVDLQQAGVSYTGTKSTFCTAPGLAVTDLVINPVDGAMYFLVGGRRSQSALYKVHYAGSQSTMRVNTQTDTQPKLRTAFKELNAGLEPGDVIAAWGMLNHADRHLRYAARTAIELQGGNDWYQIALGATDVQTKLESILALIRTCQDKSLHGKVVESLAQLEFESLTEMQKLHLLRNFGLVVARMSPLSPQAISQICDLSKYYPADSDQVNRELSRVLCALEADDVVAKTLKLLQESDSQKQQIHYAIVLHAVKNGWTTESRREFLNWFIESAKYAGGNSFRRYLTNIRSKFAGEMPETDREELEDLWKQSIEPIDPYANLKARPVVNQWALDDLKEIDFENASIENGKKMFAVTQCYKCHVVHGEGGIVGPDLTNAGRRFSTNDLLETIVDPNKEVSDQYQATVFQLEDGRMIVGRIANLVRSDYLVQEDMIRPGNLTRINSEQIEAMKPSTQSMMPSGLLDTLTKQEIADLVAYMKSAAEARVGSN